MELPPLPERERLEAIGEKLESIDQKLELFLVSIHAMRDVIAGLRRDWTVENAGAIARGVIKRKNPHAVGL